jgi:hypothetical protein
MTATATAEPTPPRRRTWLPMALWTAAIVAGLGVVWAGASVYATLREVRGALVELVEHEGDADSLTGPIIARIGGPGEAARKITLYGTRTATFDQGLRIASVSPRKKSPTRLSRHWSER